MQGHRKGHRKRHAKAHMTRERTHEETHEDTHEETHEETHAETHAETHTHIHLDWTLGTFVPHHESYDPCIMIGKQQLETRKPKKNQTIVERHVWKYEQVHTVDQTVHHQGYQSVFVGSRLWTLLLPPAWSNKDRNSSPRIAPACPN